MAERAVSRIPTSRDRTSPAARPDFRSSSAMSLTSVLNDKGAHRYGPGTAGALRRRNFDADRRSVEGITRGFRPATLCGRKCGSQNVAQADKLGDTQIQVLIGVADHAD